MRIYKTDGSFVDDPLDTDFGWYLNDIIIDESIPKFAQKNKSIKEIALFKKSQRKYQIDESIDIPIENEHNEAVIIEKHEPNIKIQKIHGVLNCKMDIEGLVESGESNFSRELKSIGCKLPSKEELINLINPCNTEAKTLLSIISYAKYKSLIAKEMSDDVLRTINFRTTSYCRLINPKDNEAHSGSGIVTDDLSESAESSLDKIEPNFKCFVTDRDANDVDKEILDEIQNYHATKEDNLLSLMMELIITDMGSNLEEMSELNRSVNELNKIPDIVTTETSDLGNSIQSSSSSKGAMQQLQEKKGFFLDIPNRSDVLSSIGLSFDIDRSLQSFSKEKLEIHSQLTEIRESFLREQRRINRLIVEAETLEKDLRATLYLDNVLHLLTVVDIYSEWCGPCLGMQPNLKKIKLDSGGDLLHLAVAKSDGISHIERFRNKSEPTWMFISKGKMVNLMFGADAPKLKTLILQELKKEQQIIDGLTPDRKVQEITERAEEEQARYEVEFAKEEEIRARVEARRAKELLERRTQECNNILENLNNYGSAIIFSKARDKYREAVGDMVEEAGLVVQQSEKVEITPEIIDELCYFAEKENEFSEEDLECIYQGPSLVQLFKISQRAEIEDIGDAILAVVYGPHKKPPGSPESLAGCLLDLVLTPEERDTNLKLVWAPRTAFVRATALRVFFPKLSKEFTIEPPPPEPDHLAVVFDTSNREEALQVMKQYPEQIMKYGFFTSEIPEEAKLVAKTLRELNSMPKRTFEEKLVIALSKQKSECVLAFASIHPYYMSPNASEGKRECAIFFPEDYVQEEEPEEEPEPEPEPVDENPPEAAEGEALPEGEEAAPGEPKEVGEDEDNTARGEGVELGAEGEGQAGEVPPQQPLLPEGGAPEPAPPATPVPEAAEPPPESPETPAE